MKLFHGLNYFNLLSSFIILIYLFVFASDIYKQPKVYPNHIHTTIYIDRNFYDYEQEIIITAAIKWSKATNHIVEYDVVQLPTNEKIDAENGLFMVKVSPDSPEIIVMDNVKNNITLGYYDTKYGLSTISLVTDRLNDYTYEQVVLHELGHSLGLQHLVGANGFNTLMYPTIDIGSETITEKDLKQFCSLYHCDVSKLKN
jgi:hypothetical protein